MIKINSSQDFKNILMGYDIFLFDMFGVIWSGKNKIYGTNETLEFLKNNGKTVIFVSNSPTFSTNLKKEFGKMDIFQNNHYDDVVASGDVFYDVLKSGTLTFKNNKQPKNCYVFGIMEENILSNIKYNIVNEVEKADFAVLGFPQLTQQEYEKIDNIYKDQLFESTMYKEPYYDAGVIDVFMDKINQMYQYNLPILSNCADLVAPQPSKKDGSLHYVIRHGSITKKYEELGGEVMETSKPYTIIYNLAFEKVCSILNCNRDELKYKKILMIGDTLDTDIRGATNATNDLNVRVDGMLTLCGVSGRKFNRDEEKIIKYAKEKQLNLNYIIDDLGIISR